MTAMKNRGNNNELRREIERRWHPFGMHYGMDLFPVVALRLPPANGIDPIRGRVDVK
jgi:hypothetical protein